MELHDSHGRWQMTTYGRFLERMRMTRSAIPVLELGTQCYRKVLPDRMSHLHLLEGGPMQPPNQKTLPAVESQNSMPFLVVQRELKLMRGILCPQML
jgi:hypothetical protein